MTDLTIDGDTFRVEVEGDPMKPALLLSNSLGTDLSLWDGQMPALTEHFRIIRYDARGHGASVADEGPYSLDRLGRDALAILDALEIATTHVMGLSMGGAVAQWLMINAPERISRGVLANTTPRFMTPEVWNTRIAQVLHDGMDETAAATIERWFSPAFRAEAPERVAAIEALVKATPPHGYAACGAALRDMDLREAIRAIEHPVLVLTGADDPVIAAADTACLLGAIADSRHVELPARHLSNVEAEAAFTEAALTFLLAKLPAIRAKRGVKPIQPLPVPARRQARRSSAARGPVAKPTSAKAAPGKITKASAAAKPSTAKPATAKASTTKASTAKASTAKVSTKGRPKVQPAKAQARKAVGPASLAKARATTRATKAGSAHPTKRVTAKPGKTPARSAAKGSATSSRASAASAKPTAKAAGKAKPATKSAGRSGTARAPSRRTAASLRGAATRPVAAKKTAAKASPVKKAPTKAASKPATRTPRAAPRKPGRAPTKRGMR